MPGTFSQIYIQIVFAVKFRKPLLKKEWRDELFKYIVGIIKAKEQKPIIVNGVEDHIHIFVGLRPSIPISDLVRDVKNNSTNFINDRRLTSEKFSWQEGYGAFSYGHSQIQNVYEYILKQEEHHMKRDFKEEYRELMEKFGISFEEKYLFD